MSWLYVPPEFCPCSPELEAWTLESAEPPPVPENLSFMLSAKPFAPASWRRAWKTKKYLRRLYGTMSQPLTAERGVALWIASLAAIHALPSVRPARGRGTKTYGTFGQKSFASPRQLSLPLSFAKTSQATLAWGFSKSAKTYKAWAMALRQEYLALQARAPHISGNASSSSLMLPTPCASNFQASQPSAKHHIKGHLTLRGMAAKGMWPTPQAHDAQKGNADRVGRFGTKHGGRNLNDEVLMWPTPTARDHKSG